MGALTEDAHDSADWVAIALTSSGYQANFSLASLKEIERFFDEYSRDGKAMLGGLLAEQLGQRMISLGW